jgi:phage-related protein
MDVDLAIAATRTVQPLAIAGGLMIGYGVHADPANVPAVTEVLNAGSARAYPVITISRSGGTGAAIYSIINLTTGDAIYLQYGMVDGEVVTIDLTPGVKTIVSNHRGNIAGIALASTGIGGFCLAPGANQISVYMSAAGAPTNVVSFTWRNRYWSTDG